MSNRIQSIAALLKTLADDEKMIRCGGGPKAIQRQHDKGRSTARERIDELVDPDSNLLEIGLYNGFGMYDEWGGAPAAGVVTTIGFIHGSRHMIVANDATVKAGAFFPATTKKVIRAQRIAFRNRLPMIYLVDSAGIFLPLQEDVFPDDDDFGRVFRNNSVLSAAGVSQIAAVMGNCVAGGSYLPVLCDKILMTDGSGLYLAGPALVKSAIGQEVSSDELGGAEMHAAVSGVIDYREPDDTACLRRLRRLISDDAHDDPSPYSRQAPVEPESNGMKIHQLLDAEAPLDIRRVLSSIVDSDSFDQQQASQGQAIICATVRIGGFSIGVVANQPSPASIECVEEVAAFIKSCDRQHRPIVFLLNRAGLLANDHDRLPRANQANNTLASAYLASRVPKITVFTDGSCGANHRGAFGRAYDPRFIFTWPGQEKVDLPVPLNSLADCLRQQDLGDDAEELIALDKLSEDRCDDASDFRHGAARGWVDAIIDPAETRSVLISALEIATRCPDDAQQF